MQPPWSPRDRGSVTIWLALASFVMIVLVGVAVDLSGQVYAQQHARDTEKLAAAFQILYDAMSDAQKKNADAFFRARGDHPTHRKG